MPEMKKTAERGRDLSKPIDHLEIGGIEYALHFDNNCFRIAEDVYELYYGRECNFAEIIGQLAKGKLGAIMAIMYGGMQSGGSAMTWAEFTEKFTLASLPGVKELLMKGVQDAMPQSDGKNTGENPQ